MTDFRYPLVPVPDDVHELEEAFAAAGHGLRIVGGWVRDLLHAPPGAHMPKDLDLATDATPAEQARVYAAMGIRHAETGLAHGTLTAITAGGAYEVTTLRTERDHDGRHAAVDWTRDWTADLSRRDLTINAMALTLRGGLLDPFGGASDLAAGRVRFVGDPAERIREDRLRILRWHRFDARFGKGRSDADAVAAVAAQSHALGDLSVERVWSEVSRILTAPGGLRAARVMEVTGTARGIGLADSGGWSLPGDGVGIDPVTVMAAWQGAGRTADLAERWRWSGAQRDKARYLAAHADGGADPRRHVAVDGVPVGWARDLAALRGDLGLREELRTWDVPVKPVRGADLVAAGMRPGPAISRRLKAIDDAWAASGYRLGREEAIAATAAAAAPASRGTASRPGRRDGRGI